MNTNKFRHERQLTKLMPEPRTLWSATALWIGVACAARYSAGCVSSDDAVIPVYEPCFTTRECEPIADRCFQVSVDYGTHVATSGICSMSCSDDFDCLPPGACLSLEGEQPICYLRCRSDFDCPTDFSCISTLGPTTFDPICLPFG